MLKDKAIASMRRAVTAFNTLDDEGRQTSVMLTLQHACEMLLKAGLRERGVEVFDKQSGRSIGFEKCVRLSGEHLGLDAEQVGLLRAIGALRDEEQHWLAEVNEGLLYLHARAAVTLFDEILAEIFSERLADHLPERVLPISTRPMTDVSVLVGEQFSRSTTCWRPANDDIPKPARWSAGYSRLKATSARRPRSPNATSTASYVACAPARASTRSSPGSARWAPRSKVTDRPSRSISPSALARPCSSCPLMTRAPPPRYVKSICSASTTCRRRSSPTSLA